MINRYTESNPNSGHGHVYRRPDGNRARCGGPRMCTPCAQDAAAKEASLAPTFTPPDFRLEGTQLFYGRVPAGEVYQEVDGCFVWVPQKGRGGCFQSNHLKDIAAFLDGLNTDWDRNIKDYFEEAYEVQTADGKVVAGWVDIFDPDTGEYVGCVQQPGNE